MTRFVQPVGLRLDQLYHAIGPIRHSGTLHGEISDVTYDSRSVQPGALFVALPGETTHGDRYIADAIQRGAVAVLGGAWCATPRNIPFFEVEDPRRAMAKAACALYTHPSSRLRTVGVTGTNGKSTVAFLLRDVLRSAGGCSGLLGTLQYEFDGRRLPSRLTTPEAPDLQRMMYEMVQAGCDSVVMEVSSHALAQNRVFGVDFNISIFTNLNQDHLDYHRTLDEYFETKSQLFCDKRGYADKETAYVLNMDDPWGRKLISRSKNRGNMVTYGMSSKACVRAENIRMHAQGTTCTIRSPWGSSTLETRLLGRFNVSNLLAAISAANLLGIEEHLVVEALNRFHPVPGRMEEIPNDHQLRIFVDYAHTEDALVNVLRTLQEVYDGRLIVVFGCGGDRDRAKRPRMGAAAVRWANEVVLTSDNPRSEDPNQILEEIRNGCGDEGNIRRIVDRRDAIEFALRLAEAGDVVLIAGKGHEKIQEIGSSLVQFDDRAIVRDWLGNACSADLHVR